MRRLLALVGYIVITFASQSIWVTFAPVTTYVASELAVPVEYVGYLAVLYPIFFLLLTVPSGVLLDKNLRLWLAFGVITTALGGLLRLVMPSSYLWLFFCQLLAAVGQPFLLNGFVPFTTHMYPQRRSVIISSLTLSMYLGTVFAEAAGLAIFRGTGLIGLMAVNAAISAAGLLLFSFSISSLPVSGGSGFAFSLRQIVNKRDLWIIGAILGLGVAAFDNLSTWLQPALATAGLGDIAGTAVALAIISGLVGTTFIPSLVSQRNLRTWYLRSAAFLASALVVTIAFLLIPILTYLNLTVAGFLMIPAYAILMEWIGRFHPRELHGSSTGFVGLVSRVLSVSLLLTAPYLIESAKIYLIFISILLFLAFIFTLFLPNDRKIKT
jgi:major facilitator 4 family protein